MKRSIAPRLFTSAFLVALASCGGGSGGGASAINSTPPPAANPAPSQSTADGVLTKALVGVPDTTNFAIVGDQVEYRWNAQSNAYEISVPGGPSGKVVQTSTGPYASSGKVASADGSAPPVHILAWVPYTYTGWAYFYSEADNRIRNFAYGVPTDAAAIPKTGTATYDATIDGHGGSYSVYGTARFAFDFGAGKLSGYMDPQLNGAFGGPSLPRYNFSETIYATGSPTFSGKFDIAGPTPSSFQGRFTGPAAQELMAQWTAPFLDDDNQWKTMSGVMVGH